MNYSAAIFDFFKSPKWLPNLLLGALCLLIPVVGPIVLIGWHSAALFGKRAPVDFDRYPPFDFNDFGKHLNRGLWPFVVNLVASMVMVPFAWLTMMVPMGLLLALMPHHDGGTPTDAEGAVMLAIFVLIGLCCASLFLILSFLLKPLMIRAILVQDFAPAFSLKFIKDFTARTWGAQILSMMAFIASSILLTLGGMMIFCVGMYAAISLLVFVQWHLNRQLYDLYLTRGGEPVPVSVKLCDTPPPLPLI